MLASSRSINTATTPTIVALVSYLQNLAPLLCACYDEVNKKTQKYSGSIPDMETTLGRIAKRRFKTKLNKRSGFWQVDPT